MVKRGISRLEQAREDKKMQKLGLLRPSTVAIIPTETVTAAVQAIQTS